MSGLTCISEESLKILTVKIVVLFTLIVSFCYRIFVKFAENATFLYSSCNDFLLKPGDI